MNRAEFRFSNLLHPRCNAWLAHAEIWQISTSDSQPLLQKAQVWLETLAAWPKSEMPR
jgi:hypothetical protein